MKRRQFFLYAMLAPLSLVILRHFGIGPKYIEKNGWILKSDDL
jgi:hypothetical protein